MTHSELKNKPFRRWLENCGVFADAAHPHSYGTWRIHMWHELFTWDMTLSSVTWLDQTWQDSFIFGMSRRCGVYSFQKCHSKNVLQVHFCNDIFGMSIRHIFYATSCSAFLEWRFWNEYTAHLLRYATSSTRCGVSADAADCIHVSHDLFICDMTRSYPKHDSFRWSSTWLWRIHWCSRAASTSETSCSYATRLIFIRTTTHSGTGWLRLVGSIKL